MSDSNNRQRIIDELDTNFLVEASAGSGKTSILVERLVAMVESGKDVSKIVALTFTKKAANEFYERFYTLLDERRKPGSVKGPHSYLKNPDDTTRGYDEKALKDIDLCFMGTIDSFCYKVLNEHPFEAGIPSNSKVKENFKDLQPTIYNFFKLIKNGEYDSKDPTLKPLLSKCEAYCGPDFHYIISVIEHSFNYRNLNIPYKSFSPSEEKEQFDDINLSLNNLKDACNLINDFTKNDRLDFHNARNMTFYYEDSIKSFNYIKHNIDKINGLKSNDFLHILNILNRLNDFKIAGKINVGFKKAIDNKFDKGKFYRFNLAGNITLNTERLVYRIEHVRGNAILEFVSKIRPHLIKYLNSYGMFTFSDNLFYLDFLLKNKDYASNILNKIHDRYSYFLIDEFQDTSPIQVDLFLRLVASNLYIDKWEDSIPYKGSLFLVGDPKQSIYHFRGADLSIYNKVKKFFDDNNLNNCENIFLKDNFRSTPELCTYFDKTFKNPFFKESSGISYNPILDSPDSVENNPLIYKFESFKDNDPSQIVKVIKTLIGDKSLNLKYEDFMVISLSKKNINKIANELQLNKIPAFQEGEITFLVTDLVKSVANLFMFLSEPNALSYYAVIDSPLFFNLNLEPENSMESSELLNKIIELFDLKDYKSMFPSEIFVKVLQSKEVLGINGLEGFNEAISLKERLQDAEKSGIVYSLKSGKDFLKKVLNEEKVERISTCSFKSNCVHLANLHKTKGLQSKVIILGYSWDNPTENLFYADEENDHILGYKDYSEGFPKAMFQLPKDTKCLDESKKREDISKNVSPWYLDYASYQEPYFMDKKMSNEEKQRLKYVAATRPKQILVMSVLPPNFKSAASSFWFDLNQIDYDRIEDIFEVYKEKSLAETNSISKGDPSSFDNNISFDLSNQESYHVELPSKLTESSALEENLLNNSSIEEIDDESITINNLNVGKENAGLKGTIVHELMEYIGKCKNNVLHESMCEKIVEKHNFPEFKSTLLGIYKSIYNGGIDQSKNVSKYNELFNSNNILEIIRNSKEVYTEVPFCYKDGDKLINGVVDLFINYQGKNYILDYKTDKDLTTNHDPQLNAYKSALKRVLNLDIEPEAAIYNIPLD